MDATRCAALGLVAGILGFGPACTNSGLGGTEDSVADSDTGPEPTSGSAGCPWEGTWALADAAKCGAFAIGNWAEVYDDVRFTATTAADGGCDLVVDWGGPDCAESEAFYVDPPAAGGEVEFVSAGVSSCEVDGCTFGTSDEAGCAPGDRAGATTVLVDGSVADTLTFTDFGNHAWSACTLEFVTTWQKQ